MNSSPKLDIHAKPEDALGSHLTEPSGDASPAVASREARRGSNRLWWALLAAFVLLLGVSIVGAARRNDDRGIRGPADQGAPEAPRDEKVPPSAKR
jgi:hypothetical protein